MRPRARIRRRVWSPAAADIADRQAEASDGGGSQEEVRVRAGDSGAAHRTYLRLTGEPRVDALHVEGVKALREEAELVVRQELRQANCAVSGDGDGSGACYVGEFEAREDEVGGGGRCRCRRDSPAARVRVLEWRGGGGGY